MAVRRTRSVYRRTKPRRTWTRRTAKGGSQWNREEIAFMRKYYRNHETSWIARQLGRTVYSVRYKASDLNIRKANPSIWRGNTGTSNKGTRGWTTTSRKRYGSPTKHFTRKSTPRKTYKRRPRRNW